MSTDFTGFSEWLPSEWFEFLRASPADLNPVAYEGTSLSLDGIPSPALLDLEYLYNVLLETPSDAQPTLEETPSSSISSQDAPDSSNSPPETAAPADDRATDSMSTSPIPAKQAATLPFNWHRIPQKPYVHGRKQRDFKPSKYISFSVNGRPGLNMGDALGEIFTGLDGRDDLVLQDANSAISCRILFPGYPSNSSAQISTMYWNKKRDPITRSKLAHRIAMKLKHYLDSMAKSHSIDGSTPEQWTIDEGFMRLNNMFLVRLESVSKGSWQPEIWVVDSTM